MTWQWWVSQAFAFVGLVFVVISFQQKTTKKLILLRNIATLMVFTGLFFLGNISAILMCGAGVIRNAVSLFYAYKPQTKKVWKISAGVLIIILLITLNIVFWTNYFNIFSMIIGSFNVLTYMQSKPERIRILSVIAEIITITYFSLLLSPINIAIEVVGLLAAVIGIIRLDRKKKQIPILDNKVDKFEEDTNKNFTNS